MTQYRLVMRERLAGFREWIEGRSPWRLELVLVACLVVGLSAIICSAYLPALHGFKAGQPSPRTVVAEQTVTVLDVQATDELRAEVAKLVEPVYMPDPEAFSKASADLSAFLEKVKVLRAQIGDTLALEKALSELQGFAPSGLTTVVQDYLLTSSASTFDLISSEALGALRTVNATPITDKTVEEARGELRDIADALASARPSADAVFEVAGGFLRPNQAIDEEQTQARREAAMAQVASVTMTVNKGDTVVQEDQTVTDQELLILSALGLAEKRTGWKIWLGIIIIVLMETALFSRLLRRYNKTTEGFGNNMLLALVLLLLIGTGVARLLLIHPLSAYVIPTAALGMTVAVILNARSALLQVALAATNVGMMTGFQLKYALVALIVGALSLYLVSRVTKRATLMAVGLATMFLAAVAIFAVELATGASSGVALQASAWGFANGFMAGVLALLSLMLLETIFNLTTPLRLLELADPAHPLLKKLLQVAPGTYNHSIQMGNLAEAAAEAIGANPLLARVGAYYHDIGKTVRPEYFVENQIYVDNPHDRLSPNLSKLAITAHVRDGEHLGKLYGLPQPVIDIMKQHHGTSVLAYFFHKAKESAKEPVYEESYRYEEQKPRSKEAAIIMLADSVEAAVRAMENPTRRKIQGVIQEIIKQKVQDGQLDESALTQGDLHKIRDSFDTSLLGLVGHRIKYPDAQEKDIRASVAIPIGAPPRRRPPSALVAPGETAGKNPDEGPAGGGA
jgi:cyclic-di-AMP phosphodiesterase PgpH